MNTEDFVTYEQARALKRLGFNVKCPHYYYVGRNFVSLEKCVIHGILDCYVAAPTLAQAQKWLRKEKNLYVCVEIDITDTVNNIFYWTIYKLPYKKQIRKTRKFDSPEEALSAGISEVINFLENG